MDDALPPPGHNQGPSEVDALTDRLTVDHAKIVQRAQNLVVAETRAPAEIETQEWATNIADLVKLMNGCWDLSEAQRKAEKEPHDTRSKTVQAFFRGIIQTPLEDAKAKLLRRLTVWERKVEKEERDRREAAAAAARAEAEARAKAAAEAAAAIQNEQDLKAAIAAETVAVEASADAVTAQRAAEAKPAELSRIRGKVSVSSLRRFWDFKDLDRATIDLEALRPHLSLQHIEQALRAHIKAGNRSIRGATIFENSSSAVS